MTDFSIRLILNFKVRRPLKIKYLRVFAVTATWSVLAYVWLYVIVVANTTDLVEPWEALLTLLFFPLLTLWAWIADKRLLVYDMMNKTYEYDAHKNLIRESEKSSKKRNQVTKVFSFKLKVLTLSFLHCIFS